MIRLSQLILSKHLLRAWYIELVQAHQGSKSNIKLEGSFLLLHNTFPQIQQLKTICIYYLMFSVAWESGHSLAGSSLWCLTGCNQGVGPFTCFPGDLNGELLSEFINELLEFLWLPYGLGPLLFVGCELGTALNSRGHP